MLDFIKPAPCDNLVSFLQKVWPAYAWARFGDLHLDVCDDVYQTFAKIKNESAIVCGNHSAHEDSEVMFGLSALLGERFEFLTARELFASKNTITAKWLQKIGCYSIERGLPDLHAFRATRDLLVKGNNKIVIFPEGEISHQNEFLSDFENGSELIALSALEELKRLKLSRSIFIVPLALQYKYAHDISPDLEAALEQVEIAQGKQLQARAAIAFKQRIMNAFDYMLQILEAAHNCQENNGSDFTKRIANLCEHVIEETQVFLQMDLPTSLSQLTRIHILKSAFIEKWLMSKEQNQSTDLPSELELVHFHRLKRMINLLAIGNHSFDHELTQEEAAEIVTVLQYEALGKISLARPKTVTIGCGELINVADYIAIYEKDKKKAVQLVKTELRNRLLERLLTLAKNQVKLVVSCRPN